MAALNRCTFEPVCFDIVVHDNIFGGDYVDNLDDLLTGILVGSLEHHVDGRFEPLSNDVDPLVRDSVKFI